MRAHNSKDCHCESYIKQNNAYNFSRLILGLLFTKLTVVSLSDLL